MFFIRTLLNGHRQRDDELSALIINARYPVFDPYGPMIAFDELLYQV
jgi:hypothetical protein